ncbi:MAG: tRNA pseudouridine(38-40) synthase TruA [Candidatus Krumholzibacteriota bacterium]
MNEVFRLRIDLAYVGTAFHGWQIQPDARSVQGDMRHELTRLLGRDAIPVAAGRTDAGVHARGQVAHLTVETAAEVDRVIGALPRMMPDDIDIQGIRRVSPSFNARHSAIARRYSYNLIQVRDIFRPHCWYIFRPLDRAAMDRAAAAFVGSHDFSSFCKAKSLKEDHNLCDVGLCAFDWGDDSAIFHVRANRFLHHMVRNMMGALAEIGRGEREADDIPRILAARSRSASGRMAPARGLFLEEVVYPERLMDPGYIEQVTPPQGETP